LRERFAACGASHSEAATAILREAPSGAAKRHAQTQVASYRNITTGKTAKLCAEIRIRGMKKYICLLTGLAVLAACEQKETTVTNPPAEKKESNTTVIQQSTPATVTKEKTEVNVNTSPNPSP
jgi:23S rRNA A1618 N6-methylase RlmF